MSRFQLIAGALLATFCLTSCNETPEFRISLEDVQDTEETLYVNATVLSPNKGPGGAKELVFDLTPYRGNKFSFGLTFDLSNLSTDEAKQARTGLLEMAFVKNGCVTRIITAPLLNTGTSNTALIPMPLKLHSVSDPQQYEEIPIEKASTSSTCYQMKRPLVTALQREISGTYGNTKSTLVVYGWGLLKGTTATAALASPLPMMGIDCATFPCSAWNTVALKVHSTEAASTTRLPLDTTPLTDTVSPLLDQFARTQTGMNKSALSFISGPQAKKMATALFPFKVTVTTITDGVSGTTEFSEPVPPPP